MNKLKIGDVVILKSGGPSMVIEAEGEYTMSGFEFAYCCVWFDGVEKKEGIFDPRTIELYKPNS